MIVVHARVGRRRGVARVLPLMASGMRSLMRHAWPRASVESVDAAGIVLRSGRRVRWVDVQSLRVRKSYFDCYSRITRIELSFRGRRAFVVPSEAEHGHELMEAMLRAMRKSLGPDAVIRSTHVQRRS